MTRQLRLVGISDSQPEPQLRRDSTPDPATATAPDRSVAVSKFRVSPAGYRAKKKRALPTNSLGQLNDHVRQVGKQGVAAARQALEQSRPAAERRAS